MKHTLLIFILVLSFVFGLASVALAQDPQPTQEPVAPTYQLPTEVPATATEGLAEIGKLLAFVGAWLTYQFMKAINTIPGASGDKARWQGLGAAAVTAVIALITDMALTYLSLAAGFVDRNGFWTVFRWAMLALPGSWAMYQTGKFTGALPDLSKLFAPMIAAKK